MESDGGGVIAVMMLLQQTYMFFTGGNGVSFVKNDLSYYWAQR